MIMGGISVFVGIKMVPKMSQRATQMHQQIRTAFWELQGNFSEAALAQIQRLLAQRWAPLAFDGVPESIVLVQNQYRFEKNQTRSGA